MLQFSNAKFSFTAQLGNLSSKSPFQEVLEYAYNAPIYFLSLVFFVPQR